jgi:hypothetical protein
MGDGIHGIYITGNGAMGDGASREICQFLDDHPLLVDKNYNSLRDSKHVFFLMS